jgi:protein-L-isoaspartate(D-aspartate) O-methyltransferase
MFERLRTEMVKKFVIDAGTRDERIIAAMRKIPRHLFVETALAHQAYSGASLPIGFGQTISHPTTVAWMTEVLEISDGDKVLEVGTGSGYQAAVLAELGAKVFTIERIPQLAERARKIFHELGYFSIAVQIGDGTVGWTNYSPFDKIIVTAGSPEVPDALITQLADRGKLIIPVGDINDQNFKIITKENDSITTSTSKAGTFVPLIGRGGWKRSG